VQQPSGILIQRRPVPAPVRDDVQPHHAGRQPDAFPARERGQHHNQRIKDDQADEEHLDPGPRKRGVGMYPAVHQVPDMSASAVLCAGVSAMAELGPAARGPSCAGTVERALDELRADGYLKTVLGRGLYVVPPDERTPKNT
jgi:hypothetical protein